MLRKKILEIKNVFDFRYDNFEMQDRGGNCDLGGTLLLG